MKKLAVLIAVLLLLAGAGAGGWWMFLRGPSSAADTASGASPTFLTLPVMTIPVIQGDRVSRTFVLQITLELPRAGDERAARAALPLLVDGVLTELHTLLARRLMEERGYDLELMKLRLEGVVAGILGPDRVTDILIRMIGER